MTPISSRDEAIRFPCRWLPDETLFSLCSRHYRLSDHGRGFDIGMELFGHPRQGSAHDLPNRIEDFAARTNGLLGTAEDIVRNHTILPFYLPFLPVSKETEALRAMLRGSVQGLRFSLGLTTSIFRANHPLRACISCMARDREEFGVAYWHLGHQFPGVSHCSIHGLPLGSSPLRFLGEGRCPWLLPSCSTVVFTDPADREIAGDGHEVRMDVSTIARAVGSLAPHVRFEPDLLSRTYVDALHRRGLVHMNSNTLRRAAVGSQYSQYLSELSGCADFSALSQGEAPAASHVARLICIPRQPTHPLWHVPVIAWLFATWPEFLKAYGAAAKSPKHQLLEEATRPATPPAQHPQRNSFLELVQGSRWSVTRAAKSVAVDVGTGLVWAAEAGIRVARRPKRLKSEVRLKMVERLKGGDSKQSVAQHFGVSIESVTRLLRTEVGLQRARKHATERHQADRARDDWALALRASKGSVKTARVIAPAAYAWLYRNQPDWLIETNAKLRVPRPSSKPRVDWKARDSIMAFQVAQVASHMRTERPGRTLYLRHFYNSVPLLDTKQSKRSRLPKTQRALRAAIKASALASE